MYFAPSFCISPGNHSLIDIVHMAFWMRAFCPFRMNFAFVHRHAELAFYTCWIWSLFPKIAENFEKRKTLWPVFCFFILTGDFSQSLQYLRDKLPSSHHWIPWESLSRSSSCCSRSAVGNKNNNGKLKIPLHSYTHAHNFVSDFFEPNNDRMSSFPDWNCLEHELQSM
jgi:hypothetical protein